MSVLIEHCSEVCVGRVICFEAIIGQADGAGPMDMILMVFTYSAVDGMNIMNHWPTRFSYGVGQNRSVKLREMCTLNITCVLHNRVRIQGDLLSLADTHVMPLNIYSVKRLYGPSQMAKIHTFTERQ